MTDTEIVDYYVTTRKTLKTVAKELRLNREHVRDTLKAAGVLLDPHRRGNPHEGVVKLAAAFSRTSCHWKPSELPELCKPCRHVVRPSATQRNRCGLRLRIDLVWSDDDTCPAWDPPGEMD